MPIVPAPSRDFPFYTGAPVRPTLPGWLLSFGVLALGLAAVMTPRAVETGAWGVVAPMLLFGPLAIAALAALASRKGLSMLHHPKGRDLAVGLACAALTLLVSIAVGALVTKGGATGVGNPSMTAFATAEPLERALFLAAMASQLLGEELLTIIPFLAILTLCCGPLRLSRGVGLAIAWLASSVVFAAIHLPTYQWHWEQTFAAIGAARLCLTLAYVITKSVWASMTAHLINDWTLLGLESVLVGSTSSG